MLAIGTAESVGHLGSAALAQPRLTRVPAGTIAQWGIHLAPITGPQFCPAVQAVADHVQLVQGAVLEAGLATTTLDHSNQIPHAQPAWIVDLRFRPQGLAAKGGCRPYASGCSGAPAFPGETARVVIVDAYTAKVVLDIPVLPSDGRHSRP